MENHLKNQNSPYLLQHVNNPVDWYPWCEEAFARAKKEDKPIFLSVGYSTCHWCHVMAHESFENEEIAGILNRHFISVKVDREERPDIDSVYMSVCQAMTGSGGWPMSIFLTPEQKPFFAGTYFPPRERYGRIGFCELLSLIVDNWKNNRAELLKSAENIFEHIRAADGNKSGETDHHLPETAAGIFARTFDREWGGFGNAPKFPTPHNLLFLLLYSQIYEDAQALEQVKVTLWQMRRGGIFDHIGYGFSRYSTDRYYLVPHFEKMLYDNALLIMAYTAAYKVSGEKEFLDTAEKTAAYVFREMTGPKGGFYSAQDADSEGGEGSFYLWSYEEVCRILGEEKGKQFCRYFGITKEGNFEGKNIPNLLNGNEASDGFGKEKEMLYEYRKSRMELHLDDKVLTVWNSLMICAMTMLYRATGEKKYLLAAERAEEFVERNLMDEEARTILYVGCRGEKRSVKGFLDDYAYYMAAMISLYEATAKEKYLERAQRIYREAAAQFSDKNGGYFLYGEKNGHLILRPKETYDGALPSGNSVMAYALVRLMQITGKEEFRRAAEAQIAFLSAEASAYPAGHCMYLISLLQYLHTPQKTTVVLSSADIPEAVIPRLPLVGEIKILPAPTRDYPLRNGKTTCYSCRGNTCFPPENLG